MNKKLTLVCLSSLTMIAVIGITTFGQNFDIFKFNATGNEPWSHYETLNPTFERNGIKEYWVSCATHQHVFEKPDVEPSNIKEMGVPSVDFLKTLDESDDRLLPEYKRVYDFEDGIVPYEMKPVLNIGSFEIDPSNGVDGSKCLKVNIAKSDYKFGLSKDYFDLVFQDEQVKSVKFSCKGTLDTNNFRYSTAFNSGGDSNTFEEYKVGSGITTDWKTFFFTRNMYNSWRSDSAMVKGGAYGSSDYLLVDNIEISKQGYDINTKTANYLGFESGTVINNSTTTNGSFSVRGVQYEVALVSGAGVDSVTFDNSKHTEGNRSLHIHKVSGKYLALYLDSPFYSSLDENGIYFDMYTDDSINSNSVAAGIQTGVNTVFNCQQVAGRWQQYHMSKAEIGTDGRLLQFSGTTPNGNIWIDNIRPANNYEDFENAYATHYGQYANATKFALLESDNGNLRDAWKNFSVIANGANIESTSISLDLSENWHNKSFKVTYSNSGYCALFLNPKLLSDNFDNGIQFDIYSEQKFTEGTVFGDSVNQKLNEWQTITLKGDELYDPAKPGQKVINGRIFSQNFLGKGSFYIDNIRPADCYVSEGIDFERGIVTKKTNDTRNLYKYILNNTTAELYFENSSSIVTNAVIEVSPNRSGKSLKITKTSGYMQLDLSANFINKLGTNDTFSFDVYSTIAANSKDAVNNMQTGVNGKIALDDYMHPANQWVTYTFKKSDVSYDSAYGGYRFIQIQGGTQGDWYFDNFRINKATRNYTDLGSHYLQIGQNLILDLGINVPKNLTLYVDEKVLSAPYYSLDGSLITIKADKIGNGEHVLKVKTNNDQYSANISKYFFATYTPTSNINLAPTLTYGSQSYQTISGLSYVNRIVFNNKSLPFERNGSNILIPDASLVECLKGASSGTIKLIAICDDYNSTITQLTYTISMSASYTPKTGYSKVAEGSFNFFGYSSTGGGVETSLNGEDYLMDYARSGMESMYEQLRGIPVDIPAHYFENYRVDNRDISRNYCDLVRCEELGLGAVISDDYTIALCSQTSSIFGRDIVLSSNTTVHFDNETDLYNALYARISQFSQFACLKKYVLCDEPRYNNLKQVGDVYKQARRVLDDLGRSDVEVNVNLLPIMAALDETGIGPDKGSWYDNFATKRKKTYQYYLSLYLDYSGADYITYDLYPLEVYYKEEDGDNKNNKSGVEKWAYISLIVTADFCKQKGVEFHVVTQTCTLINRREGDVLINDRVMTRDDMHWLTNRLMGFGVTEVAYFTYYCRLNSPEFGQMGSMMLENHDNTGKFTDIEKTTVWYHTQAVNEELNDFAKILFNFKYQASKIGVSGNYVNQGDAYTWANDLDASSYANLGGNLSSVSANNGYYLTTSLKDSDGKYMFMVENVCDPKYDQRLSTITVTFKSGYSYVQIFENGSSRIVNLSSNKVTLQLSSGNACYIIPF